LSESITVSGNRFDHGMVVIFQCTPNLPYDLVDPRAPVNHGFTPQFSPHLIEGYQSSGSFDQQHEASRSQRAQLHYPVAACEFAGVHVEHESAESNELAWCTVE